MTYVAAETPTMLSGLRSLNLHQQGVSPFIMQPPQNQTVVVGRTATFSVSAGGAPEPAYQWLKSAAPLASDSRITGTATNTLTIRDVRSGDEGTYVLQYKDQLQAPDWSTLIALPGTGGPSAFYLDTTSSPRRFFRVLVR